MIFGYILSRVHAFNGCDKQIIEWNIFLLVLDMQLFYRTLLRNTLLRSGELALLSEAGPQAQLVRTGARDRTHGAHISFLPDVYSTGVTQSRE